MTKETSNISGFRNLTVDERLALLVQQGDLNDHDVQLLGASQEAVRIAATTVENVIGVAYVPLGIATNFVIDGRPVLVPMAVEEPSVIAAASNGAKLAREGGGITTECDDPLMIGQVEIRGVQDVGAALDRLRSHKQDLIEQVGDVVPVLIDYERRAREFLVRETQQNVHDQVSRAYGILRTAQTISAEETMQLLSRVRMGVLLGLIGDVKIADINSLLVRTQPAHLQKIRGVELDSNDRNIERARYLRQHLEGGDAGGRN